MADKVYPDAPTGNNMTYYQKMAGAQVGPMPPPATYSKPYNRRHRGLGGCCCCLCTWLCSILFAVILILGIAALIIWLVLRPIHAPQYTLNSLQVKNFSLNANSQLNADFVYNVTANNPNRKIGIKYDVINLDTSYSGDVFGNSSVPAFYQGHQNITNIVSETHSVNVPLASGVASSLKTDVQKGSIPLHTRVSVKARVKVGSYTSFAFWVHVNCDVSMSPLTATKAASVISKTCKVTR